MDLPGCRTHRLWREATRGVFRDTAFTVLVVAIVLAILTLWATTPAHGAEPQPTYTYAQGSAEAKRTGKTLVTWIGPYNGPAGNYTIPNTVFSVSSKPIGPLTYGIYLSKWLPDGTHRGMKVDPDLAVSFEKTLPGIVAAFDAQFGTAQPAPIAAPAYYAPRPSVIGNLRPAFFGGS